MVEISYTVLKYKSFVGNLKWRHRINQYENFYFWHYKNILHIQCITCLIRNRQECYSNTANEINLHVITNSVVHFFLNCLICVYVWNVICYIWSKEGHAKPSSYPFVSFTTQSRIIILTITKRASKVLCWLISRTVAKFFLYLSLYSDAFRCTKNCMTPVHKSFWHCTEDWKSN